MNIESFLNTVTEFFRGNKEADVARVRLDRGVLDVAMMIAAIDGEILPAEIAAYNRLLADCRGMTKADIPAATSEMMRKMDFLASLKQSGISDRECIVSFVREATAQLSESFSLSSAADRRRAIVFWTMMAFSDGDYSSLERAAVHALVGQVATDLGSEFLAKVEDLVKGLSDPARQVQARSELEAFCC